MKRPQTKGHDTGDARVTTPAAAGLIGLLGSAPTVDGFAPTRDEWKAINRLYGLKKELPRKRPPEAPNPGREPSWNASKEAQEAWQKAKQEYDAWSNWKDTSPFFQAGADRNAVRHAKIDGLRIIAWLSRHLSEGQDPLKVVIQLASDAGWDVDPEDVDWAQTEDESLPEDV